MLRVAAYARVSTAKEDQTNSLLSKRSYFADYITHHEGWKLSEVYYDEGISGTQIKKRSGFKKMIQDALNGEVDLIITKEVARFARNTVDTPVSYTHLDVYKRQISNRVTFGLELAGIKWNSSCSLWPDAHCVVYIVRGKARFFNFFHREISGKLVYNGSNHF